MTVANLNLWLSKMKDRMHEANKATRRLLAHQCWGAIDLARAFGIISPDQADAEIDAINDYL